jgi:hypothetical protein
VFKRLFWLLVGAGFGFGLSFWLMRAVRETAARYSPDRVSSELAGAARRLGSEVRAAFREGVEQREAEIRAELARR